MIKVYVAGPISAPTLLQALNNIRRGQRVSVELLKLGYAPFCPFLDYQFQLQEELAIDQYYAYSMAWLEVSDVILVQGDWQQSKGVQAELARARECFIPICSTVEELCRKYPS